VERIYRESNFRVGLEIPSNLFGRPSGDYYIYDRAINEKDFF
jgi:hypothetical protein